MAEKDKVDEQMEKSLSAARKKGPAPPRPGPSNVARSLSPANRAQAAKQVVVKDELAQPVAFDMAFIGTGQGGGRIAHAFYSLG